MGGLLECGGRLIDRVVFWFCRGFPVEQVKYILGLTFEKNAPFKKLRVQIASEDLLKKIAGDEEELTQQGLPGGGEGTLNGAGSQVQVPGYQGQPLQDGHPGDLVFEEPLHHDRWVTLKQMAAIYAAHGTNNPASCLWRIEMAVPMPK